jgi:hypothetical protein
MLDADERHRLRLVTATGAARWPAPAQLTGNPAR